jgi:hypothetical protein
MRVPTGDTHMRLWAHTSAPIVDASRGQALSRRSGGERSLAKRQIASRRSHKNGWFEMKQRNNSTSLKKVAGFVVPVLTGRRGVAMMVAGYSVCAVVLLVYVSAQIYTYSLMEDIASRERQQLGLKEEIGLQTERYAELASKSRISRICETKLGLVQNDAGQLIRVSIDTKWVPGVPDGEFGRESVNLPGLMGRNIDEITKVIKK